MKTLSYFFVMAIILIAGCAKDETLFESPENINNQDLMLKSGKPAQPGDNLKVFRYEEGGYYYQFYDEETDLTAFVGVDIRELVNGGGLASFDVLNIQNIVKEWDEGKSSRIHVLVNQDDITVEVWEGLIYDVSQLFSVDPIYSGTGHMAYTDSDNGSYFNDNKNTSTWGLRLNGEGISIIYHGILHGHDPLDAEKSISIMLK
jgi:hypothetical protein